MSAATLATTLEVESESFKSNSAYNHALSDRLRGDVAATALGGAESSRDRHTARGKLLPRDRVEHLLDAEGPADSGFNKAPGLASRAAPIQSQIRRTKERTGGRQAFQRTASRRPHHHDNRRTVTETDNLVTSVMLHNPSRCTSTWRLPK